MGRSEYNYLQILGTKGINQQERLADPVMELADARNFWAPNGRLEKRPGYWGVGHIPVYTVNQGSYSNPAFLKEDPLGTYAATGVFGSLPVGSRWYAGVEDPYELVESGLGFGVFVTAANSNSIVYYAEYWNGTIWAPLPAVEGINDTGFATATQSVRQTTTHLGTEAAPTEEIFFCFPFPNDWAATSVNATTKYWIRFTLQSVNSSSAFDSSTTVSDAVIDGLGPLSDTQPTFRYFIAPQVRSGNRFISVMSILGNTLAYVTNSPNLAGSTSTTEYLRLTALRELSAGYVPSVAVIPQFEDIYVTYSDQTFLHKSALTQQSDCMSIAAIETDPGIVGSGADFSPDLVPQLGEWPRARHILFHRGELWVANFTDNPQQIAWSAPSPAYRVWPTSNFDVLSDTDNSPITALASLEQNVYVFKNDSIWQMVYTGVSGLGLNTYRAEKVISGVGCVAHGSVQEIRGWLYFLAEDGVYRFNGGQVEKLTDRIQKFFSRVSPGLRYRAQAINWKAKSCYMLAVTTIGAEENNHIIVYDYKNDSCWIWDGFAVSSFFTIEDSSDEERVYFMDKYSRLYQFTGVHDYGTPITAYAISQRIGGGLETSKIRRVSVSGTNLNGSLALEVQANDAPFLAQKVATLDFSDNVEKNYDVATYDVTHYTDERDRSVSVGELTSGEWFRLKLTHDEKTTRGIINEVQVGLVPLSPRP